MSGSLTHIESASVLAAADLVPDLQAALRFARAEKADATRRVPASVETVAAYLAFEAENGCKPSTIGRRYAAIAYAHKLAGKESPTTAEAV